MRPLLLGLRRRDDTAGPALEPKSGSGLRLYQLSGLPLDDYNESFDRANAADLPTISGRRVVVLGRGAWARLGLPGEPGWFSTHRQHEAVLTIIPHPSGRCRLYNSPATRARARALLQELARPCSSQS